MVSLVYDFEKVCRACLNQDLNLKSIFDVKVSEEKQIRLADFIRRMTSLKISKNDGLPENICNTCVDHLCQAYSFAQLFIATDNKLRATKVQKTIIITDECAISEEEAISESCKSKELELGSLKSVRIPKREHPFQNQVPRESEKEPLNNEETSPGEQKGNGIVQFEVKCLQDDNSSKSEDDNNKKQEETVEESSYELYETWEAKEDYDEQKNDDDSEYTESIDVFVENEPVKKAKRKQDKKHTCSVCSESFYSNQALKKHEKLHDPEKPFKCDGCSKTFSKETHLNIHARTHKTSEDKNYVCDVCGQKFLYKHLLKLHSYKHSDNKPFPCTKCDKGCTTAESLRRHMRIHDVNYKRKKHVCEICNREFPYKSFLLGHIITHTDERPFLCSLCGRGYRQSGALEYHMRTHKGQRPYECKICEKKFTSPGVLKVHMRRHTDERPYICDICGMAFRQSTDMKSHRRRHTGDKPVLCTICGKRMSTTGQLTVHLRSHTGEKPFGCTTCSKAFATKTMLVKHERIHTGDRPYVCQTCGKAFNQSSTLKAHMQRHIGAKCKQNPKQEKIDLNQLVHNSNCIILDVNNVGEAQIVQGQIVEGQVEVESGENVVILPAPVPLLQSL